MNRPSPANLASRVSPWLERLPLALGITAIAALVWAQFRGYDPLDGAYYFLVYHNPADNPDRQTRFELFARPVWLLCGENIVAFRLVTLALASGVCWIFWRNWRRFVPSLDEAGLAWWPLWFSTIAGIAWVPVALTYNSLAGIFDLVGLAVVLTLLDRARLSPKSPFIRLGLLGTIPIIAACLFFAKPPAAVSYVAWAGFLFFFSPWLSRRMQWGVGAILTVVISCALLFVRAQVTRSDFDPDSPLTIGAMQLSPAWAWLNLQRYLDELARFWSSLRSDLQWVLAPAVLALLAGFSRKADSNWSGKALVLLLGTICAVTAGHRLWDCSFSLAVSGEAARFYLIWWGALLPVWFVSLWRTRRQGGFAHVPWVIVLFAVPVTSSFGSTNTVYVSALHQTVLWTAGLLLMADRIATACQVSWFRRSAATLLTLGVALHLFTGHFWKPYMFQPALWRQTEPAKVGYPTSTVKVEPKVARFLTLVRSVLDENGYQPGDDVFGFFNLPGVIYAVGARQPGAAWYFGTWYQNYDADGDRIRQVPAERRQRAWIITQAEVIQFRKQFHEAGIDFPDGYMKIGQTINPATGLEIGIWKPKSRL